jgi:transketolase
VSIEAGATQCWQAVVGDRGRALGLDHFGASAPYQTLYQEFGLTVDRILEAALQVVADA